MRVNSTLKEELTISFLEWRCHFKNSKTCIKKIKDILYNIAWEMEGNDDDDSCFFPDLIPELPENW